MDSGDHFVFFHCKMALKRGRVNAFIAMLPHDGRGENDDSDGKERQNSGVQICKKVHPSPGTPILFLPYPILIFAAFKGSKVLSAFNIHSGTRILPFESITRHAANIGIIGK